MSSWDSLCVVGQTLISDYPDIWGLHPTGFIDVLRPEAHKAFVVFTDDRVNCSFNGIVWNDVADTSPTAETSAAADVAIAFDGWLLSHAPAQFGSVEKRRYGFYSVVGVAEKPNPVEAYAPWEPSRRARARPPSARAPATSG